MAVQSNRRGTSRGRGGSRLARTRLTGDDAASASDDSSKSAYMHARTHAHTHMHTCTHTRTHAHTHTRTHAHMHPRAQTHTYTHTHKILAHSCLLTDHENPPPESCDVGETQADAQNRGTKTRAVQSNRRGTSRGRGGSQLTRTRLAGGHTASASDDSGKSAYMHAHAHTHTHTRTHMHTHAHTHIHTHTHRHTHTHTDTHTHRHTQRHTQDTCSFLFINSTDHENPPPESCAVGETQAGARNRGTKTRAVQSNRRGTSRGRGGSRLARTRLTGDDAASASDDSSKSAYMHARTHAHTHTRTHAHMHPRTHTHTHTHTLLAHSCLLTQQITRILLLNLVPWERHKQVRGIVAPRLELFSLTGEEPAVAGEGAGLLVPD